MNIKDDIIELSEILNKLDEFDNAYPEETQRIDYKLSDLYHKLENSKLNSKNCYRFCKELREVLKERRELKNNYSVYCKYKSIFEKMVNGIDNRKIALSQICQEDKKVRTSQYHNRIYTEEELSKIIGE